MYFNTSHEVSNSARVAHAFSRCWAKRGERDPPHNLNHLLYRIRFFKLRFFLVASLSKIRYKKRRDTPVLAHGRSLTTNHLP
jgi:hypothetical protein